MPAIARSIAQAKAGVGNAYPEEPKLNQLQASVTLPPHSPPPFRHEEDKRKHHRQRSQKEPAHKRWPETPSAIMSDGPGTNRADRSNKRDQQTGREIPEHAASSEAYHAPPARSRVAPKRSSPKAATISPWKTERSRRPPPNGFATSSWPQSRSSSSG